MKKERLEKGIHLAIKNNFIQNHTETKINMSLNDSTLKFDCLLKSHTFMLGGKALLCVSVPTETHTETKLIIGLLHLFFYFNLLSPMRIERCGKIKTTCRILVSKQVFLFYCKSPVSIRIISINCKQTLFRPDTRSGLGG